LLYALLVADLEPLVDDAHAPAYRAFVREVLGPRARATGLVARLGKGMMSAVGYLPTIAATACTTKEARAVEAFFAPRLSAVQGSPRALAQTVERIGQCAARREAQQASAHAFLDRRGATSR
jgi:hypothetical protein